MTTVDIAVGIGRKAILEDAIRELEARMLPAPDAELGTEVPGWEQMCERLAELEEELARLNAQLQKQSRGK